MKNIFDYEYFSAHIHTRSTFKWSFTSMISQIFNKDNRQTKIEGGSSLLSILPGEGITPSTPTPPLPTAFLGIIELIPFNILG